MGSFVGAFGCPRLRRIRRVAGYIAAVLAASVVLGIAVATLPRAAWAKPKPSEETIWSPQGWPLGVR